MVAFRRRSDDPGHLNGPAGVPIPHNLGTSVDFPFTDLRVRSYCSDMSNTKTLVAVSMMLFVVGCSHTRGHEYAVHIDPRLRAAILERMAKWLDLRVHCDRDPSVPGTA